MNLCNNVDDVSTESENLKNEGFLGNRSIRRYIIIVKLKNNDIVTLTLVTHIVILREKISETFVSV